MDLHSSIYFYLRVLKVNKDFASSGYMPDFGNSINYREGDTHNGICSKVEYTQSVQINT